MSSLGRYRYVSGATLLALTVPSCLEVKYHAEGSLYL